MSKRKWSLVAPRCEEAFSWPVVRLGNDEYGTWLGSRRGSQVRQPDGRHETQQDDAVWLIGEGTWWLPAFWFTDRTDLTIDICTPPSLEGRTWSFVDLELDLIRQPDGQAGIVDQDEFQQLVDSGQISDHEVQEATDTALSLLPLVQERAEPFGDAALPWIRLNGRHRPVPP